MELTPEEKHRIYLEEKARVEAQARVQAERQAVDKAAGLAAKQAREQRRLRIWGPIIVGILILFIWSISTSDPSRQSPSSSPPSSSSESNKPSSPSCDLPAAEKIVDRAFASGLLTEVRKLQIYVGPAWHELPLHAKENLDTMVQCVAMKGGDGRIMLSYHDGRTGKQIATSTYKFKME